MLSATTPVPSSSTVRARPTRKQRQPPEDWDGTHLRNPIFSDDPPRSDHFRSFDIGAATRARCLLRAPIIPFRAMTLSVRASCSQRWNRHSSSRRSLSSPSRSAVLGLCAHRPLREQHVRKRMAVAERTLLAGIRPS